VRLESGYDIAGRILSHQSSLLAVGVHEQKAEEEKGASFHEYKKLVYFKIVHTKAMKGRIRKTCICIKCQGDQHIEVDLDENHGNLGNEATELVNIFMSF
jgi:hypothetical protein